MKIAETILKVPEEHRNGFIDELNKTKEIIAAETPNSADLILNAEEVKKYNCRGFLVTLTNKDGGCDLLPFSVFDILSGKKNKDFGNDMKDEFALLRQCAIKRVCQTTKEPPRSVPKTPRDVLGRLY